jgi:hypothetical protein
MLCGSPCEHALPFARLARHGYDACLTERVPASPRPMHRRSLFEVTPRALLHGMISRIEMMCVQDVRHAAHNMGIALPQQWFRDIALPHSKSGQPSVLRQKTLNNPRLHLPHSQSPICFPFQDPLFSRYIALHRLKWCHVAVTLHRFS